VYWGHAVHEHGLVVNPVELVHHAVVDGYLHSTGGSSGTVTPIGLRQ